jgi:hypothetical protein
MICYDFLMGWFSMLTALTPKLTPKSLGPSRLDYKVLTWTFMDQSGYGQPALKTR